MLTKLLSKVKQEKTEQSTLKKSDSTTSANQEIISAFSGKYLTSLKDKKWDLNDYKMPDIETVFYVPNFISEEDEQFINANIYEQPKDRWTALQHSGRRLQKWGGDVTKDGLDNNEPLPDWLEKISEFLQSSDITQKKTNHVLLNEYEPGVGIMPHTDGPLYHPYVVILSLGSSIFFEFFKDYQGYKDHEYLTTLLVEPRSLLIFTGDAYHKVLHCIEDNKIDFISVGYQVDEQKNVLIKHSNIANLQHTNYFKTLEAEIKAREDLEPGVTYKKVDESRRKLRNSLTIRYVPLKQN